VFCFALKELFKRPALSRDSGEYFVYCLTVSVVSWKFVIFGRVQSYSREFDFARIRFHCIRSLIQEPF